MRCRNRHELPADKALLRMRHYHDSAPEANAGNAAMHLANFALHAVAARSARLQDPRMRSLRSVGHLQVRLLQNLADSISRFSKHHMRLPGVAPLISCLRCVDAHKLRVDCLCRACTQETGACIGGASASLSGGGAAMCMATCQPSCYTSTGLAQVRPARAHAS